MVQLIPNRCRWRIYHHQTIILSLIHEPEVIEDNFIGCESKGTKAEMYFVLKTIFN